MRPSRLRRSTAHNLSTLRTQPLAELSGALGDLGTLLPLMLALAAQNSISLPATLVVSGLANILTGAIFGLPLPVQPMKAIASIAISSSLGAAETASAGLFVAGAVGALGITGLLRWAARVVPTPVVRGIQVGAGLALISSAGTTLLVPLGWTGPRWGDNLLWALGAAALLLISQLTPRMPYALLVTVLGLGLAVPIATWTGHESWVWRPGTLVPTPGQFRDGAWRAGLPQLPLTLLNSVLAASSLARTLFDEYPSVTELGISVAGFNLVGAWFGAMPICHGSGGLAAQYRFGARSGASVVLLGALKVVLGLFAADKVMPLLRAFPHALLGVMVLAAGVELARVGRDLSDQNALWEQAESERPQLGEDDRWMVMLVTAAGCVAFKNDAVGFAAGMVWHWGLVASRRLQTKADGERAPLLHTRRIST